MRGWDRMLGMDGMDGVTREGVRYAGELATSSRGLKGCCGKIEMDLRMNV